MATNCKHRFLISRLLYHVVDFSGPTRVDANVYALCGIYVHPLDLDCADLAGVPFSLLALQETPRRKLAPGSKGIRDDSCHICSADDLDQGFLSVNTW